MKTPGLLTPPFVFPELKPRMPSKGQCSLGKRRQSSPTPTAPHLINDPVFSRPPPCTQVFFNCQAQWVVPPRKPGRPAGAGYHGHAGNFENKHPRDVPWAGKKPGPRSPKFSSSSHTPVFYFSNPPSATTPICTPNGYNQEEIKMGPHESHKIWKRPAAPRSPRPGVPRPHPPRPRLSKASTSTFEHPITEGRGPVNLPLQCPPAVTIKNDGTGDTKGTVFFPPRPSETPSHKDARLTTGRKSAPELFFRSKREVSPLASLGGSAAIKLRKGAALQRGSQIAEPIAPNHQSGCHGLGGRGPLNSENLKKKNQTPPSKSPGPTSRGPWVPLFFCAPALSNNPSIPRSAPWSPRGVKYVPLALRPDVTREMDLGHRKEFQSFLNSNFLTFVHLQNQLPATRRPAPG